MEQFTFDRPKAIFDAAFVEVDIAEWLEAETIQDVVYSAVDSSGGDATSVVINLGRSTYQDSRLLPFIQGGVDGETYTALCQVTTIEGNFQEFRIKFRIREAP